MVFFELQSKEKKGENRPSSSPRPTFRGVAVLVGVNSVGGEGLHSRAEELRCVAASERWEAGWNCRLRHA